MSTLSEQLNHQFDQSIQKFNDANYDWLMQFDRHFTHAVTFTFNPRRIRRLEEGNDETFWVPTKADILELQKKSFRCFRFKLNKLLFGNDVTRRGRGVLMVPIIEGLYSGGRVHYHCAIAVPADRMSVFEGKLRDAWRYAPLSGDQVDIQPYRNQGWLGYISKHAKYLNRECIDWDNVFVPKCFEPSIAD